MYSANLEKEELDLVKRAMQKTGNETNRAEGLCF